MKYILIWAAFVLLGSTFGGAAWVPVDCHERLEEWRNFHRSIGRTNIEKLWQDYRKGVLNAKPRTPLYAPHPYSKDQKEIVENFRYAYFNRLFDGVAWEKLPARERPIYSALKEDRLRVEILKVENWDLSRCEETSPSPFFYLLRFYNSTGQEVARSKQYETGHMALYRQVSQEEKALPSLAGLSTLLRTRFARSLPIEQPQYVITSGLPYCWNADPCIAFKSQGKIYLLDGGELLYEIDPKAPRRSIMAHRQQQAQQLAREGFPLLGAREFETPMVSLGWEWAQARLVGGQKPE